MIYTVATISIGYQHDVGNENCMHRGCLSMQFELSVARYIAGDGI